MNKKKKTSFESSLFLGAQVVLWLSFMSVMSSQSLVWAQLPLLGNSPFTTSVIIEPQEETSSFIEIAKQSLLGTVLIEPSVNLSADGDENTYDFVAIHAHLPVHSIVRIINPVNQKSSIVRITQNKPTQPHVLISSLTVQKALQLSPEMVVSLEVLQLGSSEKEVRFVDEIRPSLMLPPTLAEVETQRLESPIEQESMIIDVKTNDIEPDVQETSPFLQEHDQNLVTQETSDLKNTITVEYLEKHLQSPAQKEAQEFLAELNSPLTKDPEPILIPVPDAQQPLKAPSAVETVLLQIGAFKDFENVLETVRVLKSVNLDPSVSLSDSLYRVYLAKVPLDQVENLRLKVLKAGFSSVYPRKTVPGTPINLPSP